MNKLPPPQQKKYKTPQKNIKKMLKKNHSSLAFFMENS